MSATCATKWLPAILASLMLAGCGTTNTVILKPLETRYPVSASAQYVDANGSIVTEDEYEIVKSFAMNKTIEGPLGDDTESPLELKADLDRYVSLYKGDAVTRVKIVGSSYDVGSIRANSTWKLMGWSIGLSGAGIMLAGGLLPEEKHGDDLLIGGAAFFGVGLAAYLMSYVDNDPTTWDIQVSGEVVRLNTHSCDGQSPLAPCAAK